MSRNGKPSDSGRKAGGYFVANRKPSQEILYRLADNVKVWRSRLGYTQEQLARMCACSKTYVGNVEQGCVNITLANLEAIATELGCTESDLLKRKA